MLNGICQNESSVECNLNIKATKHSDAHQCEMSINIDI